MDSTRNFRLAVAGILLFILLSSVVAVHGDLFIITWVGHFVSEGHLNVYQTLYDAGSSRLEMLTYPPLTYLFFGLLISFGKLFGLFQYPNWNDYIPLHFHDIFFIRLFYLPFLVLMAWTGKRFAERFLFEDETPERRASLARLAFLLNLTSPICLFSGLIMGQFDVMPSSLLFLGVYLLASRRLYWGVLAVCVGVWLKNFPVLFLVFAAPLLWAEFGGKKTLGALALGAGLSLLHIKLFRGPGMKASYLAFKHTDYTVLFTSGMGVNASLSNFLFLALFVACVGLTLFRTRLLFWEKLLFAYAGSMIALLAPRFWMPQYMTWAVPVLTLFVLLLSRLKSPLFPALYLAANALFLAITFVLFPGNVDTNMFSTSRLPSVPPPLGDVLGFARLRNESWTAMSACLLLMGALISVQLFAGQKLRDRLESTLVVGEHRQLGATTLLSLVLFAGFIVAHLLNLYVHRVG